MDVNSRIQLITSSQYGGMGDRSPRRMTASPAESMRHSFRPSNIEAQSRTIALGSLERDIRVDCAPDEQNKTSFELQYTDYEVSPGPNAYWIKVVQTDMEMAWASPFFVDFSSEAG
jgi:hypothetical protein